MDPLKLAKQVLLIFSKLISIYNSSTINESIMMGVAAVTKHVIGHLSKMAKAGQYKLLISL